MICIYTTSEHDLDAQSISAITKSFGLKSKLVLNKDDEISCDLNVLTYDFILKNNIRLGAFDDPVFVNAYSRKALRKIGIEPSRIGTLNKLCYLGDEYFSNLLIHPPKFFFKGDEPIVEGGNFTALGLNDGIALSTIPLGQFLIIRNGWISRRRNLGGIYPTLKKFPLIKTMKNAILPVYNIFRKSTKRIDLIGYDLSLLLRESFIKCIEIVSDRSYMTSEKKHSVLLTHDVDSPESLAGIAALKEIEETFDFPSSWYINKSAFQKFKEQYKLKDCYSHYTDHDGKLAYAKYPDLVRSLKKFNLNNGFRAPWLHHTVELFEALDETGYTHDSTMPSYESFTPFYQPGGCMDIVPFKPLLPSLKECHFLEIPITLQQDYGLFNVYGLGPEDSFIIQKKRIEFIARHNGLVNIVTHPDLKDSGSKKGQRFYQLLLEYISSKKNLNVTEVDALLKNYN